MKRLSIISAAAWLAAAAPLFAQNDLVGALPRTPAQSLAGDQRPAPLLRGRAVRAAAMRPWNQGESSRSAPHSGPNVAASVLVGAASDSADTGVTLGGSLLFDVNARMSIEGQGSYLGRGEGADAFQFSGSVLVNLLPATRTLVPYAAVGGGLYHVSFDLDRPRFLGPAGTQFAAGTRVCPAPGSGFGVGPGPGFGAGRCPAGIGGYWGVGALPTFYARRVGAFDFPRGGQWGARDFTDPSLNIGGGLRFDLSERLMVRPDARALVVFGDGDTHTIGVFVVHVGYRF